MLLSSPIRYERRYGKGSLEERSEALGSTPEKRTIPGSSVSRIRTCSGQTSASSTSGSWPSVARNRNLMDSLFLDPRVLKCTAREERVS
jgi:hypothetical protein